MLDRSGEQACMLITRALCLEARPAGTDLHPPPCFPKLPGTCPDRATVAIMEPLDRADLIYHETQEGALCGEV